MSLCSLSAIFILSCTGSNISIFVYFKLFCRLLGYPLLGMVNHYRFCRRGTMPDCMTKYERITDTVLAEMSLHLQHNVEAVRKAVFGSSDLP